MSTSTLNLLSYTMCDILILFFSEQYNEVKIVRKIETEK